MAWHEFRRSLRSLLASSIWSYGPDDVAAALRRLGIGHGDTVMVHASWLPDNGFRGSPAGFVAALKRSVGAHGLLSMMSMPYHNESSAEYLARGRPLDIRRTPSRMGLLSEIFRRDPEVRRSASPTHPVLAWGADAGAFVAGHDGALVPFGAQSPFRRLLDRKARILLVDTPFASVTFTHFLEDRIESHLPFRLYEPAPRIGTVIDERGQCRRIPAFVISREANAARREAVLVNALEARGAIRRRRLGNTGLMVLNCEDMTACVDEMIASGRSFFDMDPAPTPTPATQPA